MGSLAVRLIKNSVVYPTIRVASHPGKLLMGVYDDNDEYVEDTALNRRAGEQGEPMPRDLFPQVTDSDAPEAIYAGTLYYHFGHFLLESLARAWYANQHPDLPFVWAGQQTGRGPSCVRGRQRSSTFSRSPTPPGSSPIRRGSRCCTSQISATATTTGSTPSTPHSWAATRDRHRFVTAGCGCRAARPGARSATSTRSRPSGGSPMPDG